MGTRFRVSWKPDRTFRGRVFANSSSNDLRGESWRKAAVIDEPGGITGAGTGGFCLVGDGAKFVRSRGDGGYFLTVVMAKGDIASTMACVLIGPSSSLSCELKLFHWATLPFGRPLLAGGVTSGPSDRDAAWHFSIFLVGESLSDERISSLNER